MLNYTSAYNMYYQCKRDVYIGVKLRDDVYMKYNPTEKCFVVSEVTSSYKLMHDPEPDRHNQMRSVRLPKAFWTMRPYAKIYEDRIEIIEKVHNKYLEMFDIFCTSLRTIKLSGSTWHYKDQKANGNVPVVIKDDTITVLGPPKMRTMNPEKQKEMNRLIQSVRNWIRVRAKLGAFDKITPSQINKYMAQQTGGASKWQVLDNPAKFIELLKAVDPENIKSFYPLLWLSYNGRNGHINLVERYNNLMDRMREKMRHELGVVEYVEEGK